MYLYIITIHIVSMYIASFEATRAGITFSQGEESLQNIEIRYGYSVELADAVELCLARACGLGMSIRAHTWHRAESLWNIDFLLFRALGLLVCISRTYFRTPLWEG